MSLAHGFRLAACAAAVASLFEPLPARSATVSWVGTSGFWDVATNWSSNPLLPGVGDDVVIGVAGLQTITHGTGTDTVRSINNDETLVVNGGSTLIINASGIGSNNTGTLQAGGASAGTLTFTGSATLNNAGGTLRADNGGVVNLANFSVLGGTLATSGSGVITTVAGTAAGLNAVTLSAGTQFNVVNNSALYLRASTITNHGTIAVNAGGNLTNVVLDSGSATLAGSGSLVLNGVDARLYAGSASWRLTNDTAHTIAGYGQLGAGSLLLTNSGQIDANVNGQTLLVQVQNATSANSGTMRATNGGILKIDGSTINNTGGTIRADNASFVQLADATINNGTLTSSGSGAITTVSSTAAALNAVTLGTGTQLNVVDNSALALRAGTITNHGTIAVNAGGNLTNVVLDSGSATLAGSGTLTLGGANARLYAGSGNWRLTNDTAHTIAGYGQLGANSLLLTNNGLIDANASGETLLVQVQNASSVNAGTMRASNGGILQINASTIANTGGTILANAGSFVQLADATINNGTLTSSGSGVITTVAGAAAALKDVTLGTGTQLNVVDNSALALRAGTITNNGTISVNAGGNLTNVVLDNGSATLSGSGKLVLSGTNARLYAGSGSWRLTNNTTIQGFGQLGVNQTLLTNNGLIDANVNGQTLLVQVQNATSANSGTMRATNGGILKIDASTIDNSGGTILADNASFVQLANATINNGTLTSSGSGVITTVNGAAAALDGVTLASGTQFKVVVNSALYLRAGTVTNNGTISVNPGGNLTDVRLGNGSATLAGSGQLTLGGTNARLYADSGSWRLTNNSTIQGSGQLGVNQTLLTNNGLIDANVNGQTLLVQVQNATSANAGTMRASNGGILQINASTIDNTGGTILADNASFVQLANATINNGTLTSSGSGAITTVAGNAAALDGATLASGTQFKVVDNSALYLRAGTVTNNGTISVNPGGNLADVRLGNGSATLAGSGQLTLGGANARLYADSGSWRLTNASTIDGAGQIGLGQMLLTNQGVINSNSGGAINIVTSGGAITNTGTLRAQNGALTLNNVVSGAGTLRVDAAGSMTLANGANAQAQLVMGAAGAAINIGTGNLTISGDYTNANFGVGNGFDRRAGVSGAGKIVAGGNAAQVISGTNVTGGNTANATLTIGNVRVGANTFDYQIGNAGSTGPTLRGAIQTGVNGSNLTDARLSGSGVTAGNYNAGAPGANSGNLAVVFTAASAGALAPLSGQVLNLRSNFENIADQKLNIVFAGGAAAYNAAAGNATPSPTVDLGNARVGGTLAQTFSVANTAPSGLYSEDLNASFAAQSGAASHNGGSISGLLAGASNGSAMSASLSTASAGAKTGTVTIDYQTAGAVGGVSNGLGVASAGSQTVTLNGAVFNTAAGSTSPSPVMVANQRVGGSNTAALTVSNIAAAGAYSEDLRASFGANAGAALNNSGVIGALLAGSSDNTTMKVGVDTSSAGAKSGSVTVNYQTAGTVGGASNGLGLAAANAPQTINVSGNVYNAAVGSTSPSPVTVANQHVGGSNTTTLTVNNTAVAGAYSEDLRATFGTNTGAATNNSGVISALLAGSSNNTTMKVGVDTSSAGAKSGSVSVNYQTTGTVNGTSNGLALADANAPQTIAVSGNVYRLAQANTIGPISFGNVLKDSVQTRTVSISNLAAADGFSEALNAAFGSIGGANADRFSTSGSIAGLLAGQTNNANMVVTLNTSSTGSVSANVQILLDSNGTAIGNGLGLTALATQVINLDGLITAQVGSLASAGLSPTTVNFGKFREGQVSSQTQALTVSNLSVGPAEGLNASFGATTGSASHNGGTISGLAAGGSNSAAMNVTLNGVASAGAKSGTVTVNFESDGTYNNGVKTPLDPQQVTLNAEVYRLATTGVTPAVNLAARRVGDAAATGTLNIANTAANDGYSEGLRGTIGAAPAGFSVSGPAGTGLVAAGASVARTVSLSTATAGSFGGNVNVALASDGTGTSGFGLLSIGSADAAVSGKVYAPAVKQLDTPVISFGIVRKGDVVAAQNVTVTNAAGATALNDTMAAAIGAVTGPFSGSGSASGLGAGQNGSGTMTVGLSTASAGIFNGSANVGFASQNPDMADLDLGTLQVSLSGQVNNIAEALFVKVSGAGTLSQTGNDFTLDLGTLYVGDSISSVLGMKNNAAGPAADSLSGIFGLAGAGDFGYSGWDPISALAFGLTQGGLQIGQTFGSVGLFTDLVRFDWASVNGVGPDLAFLSTLTIRANVIEQGEVPEPSTIAMVLLAAALALGVRRRSAARLH